MWERTGQAEWRDRILRGLEGILASPFRFLTGNPFSYEPESGEMTHSEEYYKSNGLVMNFGAPELLLELVQLLPDERLADAIAEYGRLYALPAAARDELPEDARMRVNSQLVAASDARLSAYCAVKDGDDAIAKRAVELLHEKWGRVETDPARQLPPSGDVPTPFPKGDNRNHFSNVASQWSLSIISMLALVPTAIERRYGPSDNES